MQWTHRKGTWFAHINKPLDSAEQEIYGYGVYVLSNGDITADAGEAVDIPFDSVDAAKIWVEAAYAVGG